MIEAVNSVLANASLSRGSAVQASTAAKVSQEFTPPPRAPFISPRIALDTSVNKAVIQIRDSDTGDVLNQYPTESQLKAYQRAQAAETQPQLRSQEEVEASLDTEAAQPAPQPEQTSVQQSAPITEAVSVDTQA